MNFYLKNGKTKFVLPVSPESYEIPVEQKTNTVTLVNGDEVELPAGKSVSSITIKSFFPVDTDASYAKSNTREPMWYIQKIQKWQTNKDIIRLIIPQADINMQCRIVKFSYGQTNQDVDYTLELHEYRDISPRKRVTKKVEAQKYKTKEGDTLQKIAKKIYGTAAKKYQDLIYKQNKNKITNKTDIKKGTVLTIPAQEIVLWKEV